MKPRVVILELIVLLAAQAACGAKSDKVPPALDAAELARREQSLAAKMASPDSESAPDAVLARWVLPDRLREISGLALTSDGRLLAHGDQKGHVFEIDYKHGVVMKDFVLGKAHEAVKGDFEGIAVAGEADYLFTSGGRLFEFHEGQNGASVDYTLHETGLGDTCEFEGIAFAKAINSLLLACKSVHDKQLKDSLVIFRWKLDGAGAQRVSRLTVPLVLAIGSNAWKTLHPSDITVEPVTGNYVLIASREHALIEITPDGKVVSARALPGEHPQPEGVAITPDGLLIISDEGGSLKNPPLERPAVITIYRWR